MTIDVTLYRLLVVLAAALWAIDFDGILEKLIIRLSKQMGRPLRSNAYLGGISGHVWSLFACG